MSTSPSSSTHPSKSIDQVPEESPSQQKPFRVLTLDGGGMRGLYTACVLQHLEARFRSLKGSALLDIGRGFDLIVGTSTGAILAAGLAAGFSVDRIIDLYEKEGPKIFANPMPNQTKRRSFYLWAWRCRNKPANQNTHLKRALEEVFKNETLGEVYERRRIGLCVPSTKVFSQKPRIFKTPHLRNKLMDVDYRLVDVCLASSAAPLFLPLVSLRSPGNDKTEHVYADGGLWGNNPILIGLAEALTLNPNRRPIEILSMSTAPPPEGEMVAEDELLRGLRQWWVGVKPLTLSMNAQSASSNYFADLFCRHLRSTGREVSCVRLPTTPLPEQVYEKVKMDRATKESIRILKTIGDDDGNKAFQMAQDEDSTSGRIIHETFFDMPPMPESSETE